jgi:hypothetical protein
VSVDKCHRASDQVAVGRSNIRSSNSGLFWISQAVAEVPGDRNVILPVDAADPGHDSILVGPFLAEMLVGNDGESLGSDRVRTDAAAGRRSGLPDRRNTPPAQH